MRLTLTLLLLSAGLQAALGENGEVRFKPKEYSPRSTLETRSYSGSSYTPSARPAPIGTPLAAPKKWNWPFFSSKAPALEDKKFSGGQDVKAVAYKQQKQTSVPTIKATPATIQEEKRFDAAGKNMDGKDYKAPEPSNEKNPLLAPRQGIKVTE
jgi:hypothetical protein